MIDTNDDYCTNQNSVRIACLLLLSTLSLPFFSVLPSADITVKLNGGTNRGCNRFANIFL